MNQPVMNAVKMFQLAEELVGNPTYIRGCHTSFFPFLGNGELGWDVARSP